MFQVISILVLMIHHNGTHDNGNSLPHWARVLFLHWLAKALRMSRYITSDDEHQAKMSITRHSVAQEIVELEETLGMKFGAKVRTGGGEVTLTSVRKIRRHRYE